MARPPTGKSAEASELAAEVRHYSRTVRWMKVVLPICALLLIVMIFLSGRTREAVIATENAATAAALGIGLKLENPRFAGITDSGEPFVVTAASALPDGAAPDRVDLERPNGELHMSDGRVLTMTSTSGRLYRKSERLVLQGAVTLSTSDGYVVSTDRVDMDLDNRHAVTPGAIAASGPVGSITADRARLETLSDEDKVVLRFEGNVRLLLRPGQSD